MVSAFTLKRSAILTGSLIGGVLLGIAFAGLIIIATGGIDSLDVPTWPMVWSQIASYVPIAAALFVLPWAAGASFSDLGLCSPSRRAVLIAVGCAGVALPSASLVEVLQIHVFHLADSAVGAIRLFSGANPLGLTIAFTVITVIFAPVIEELLFRGAIFGMLRRYTSFPIAAGISAVLFAAAHAEWTTMLPLTVVGLILAYVYVRTGSLVASMITHGLFNAVNVALVLWGYASR
jgi:membrane protease YdiL (CAAX protease family)